jgi:hypothetical protein
MARFNELVPRSRMLQKFVLRPYNVRVALLPEEEQVVEFQLGSDLSPPVGAAGLEAAGGGGQHEGQESSTPNSTDSPAAAVSNGASSSPADPGLHEAAAAAAVTPLARHRKPATSKRRSHSSGGRRSGRNLSPLKSATGRGGSGSGGKPRRKPLSRLQAGGNSAAVPG